jgi:glycosyltransferase involved in cell wall biosynthesis
MKKQLNKIIKIFLYYTGALLPLKKNRIFSTLMTKSNITGPTRFLYNLEYYLEKDFNVRIERYVLGRAKSVLIFSSTPFESFYKLCKFFGIKTVVRVDGFYMPTVFDNVKYENKDLKLLDEVKIELNQGMQKALLKADWVVYQSYFSKEMADKFLYNRIDRYSIIYNGVNLEHFKPIGYKKDYITIMVLGTWRDYDLLVCYLKIFKKCFKIYENIRFNILGNMSSDLEQKIISWIKENNMIDTINLVGKVTYEQLPQEINKNDISLHLKSADWCPNAVLETLACGVPVICTDVGGTKELVGIDELIINHEPFLYDDELVSKVFDKIDFVLKDIEKFKQKARIQAEKFDLSIMAKKYNKVLNGENI